MQEEPPEKDWEGAYGANDHDTARSTIKTSDGGYLFAGNTNSKGVGEKDAWLVKVDREGTKQWDKTYGGNKTDEANSVIQTSDGGYLFAGYSDTIRNGLRTAWLVKVDNEGTGQWERNYGDSDSTAAVWVIETSDGNYLLACHKGTSEELDSWLVKVDREGSIQWEQTYGGSDFDTADSVIETSDSSYLFAGSTESNGSGEKFDSWLVKVDREGSTQWEQTYGGSDFDTADSVIETSDDGYLFAGTTRSKGSGAGRAWLVKVDREGITQWDQTYGESELNEANSVIETSDGGYLFAGRTDGFGNAWLVKVDHEGTKLWEQTYGGSESDVAHSVIKTGDASYLFVGETKSKGSGENDAWLVKLGDSTTSESSTTTPTEPSTTTATSTPTRTPSLTGRLERAEIVGSVKIDGTDYLVFQVIPDEPSDRYAFTDIDSNLLEPDRATDVATTFTWMESYGLDSSRRLEYTNEQHQKAENVENLARTADILAELSGAIALANIDPKSSVSYAAESVTSAIEWHLTDISDPYREQYTNMAAASTTVSWAEEEVADPGASLLRLSSEALDIGQVMLDTASTIDAGEDLVSAASTVHEVIQEADSIRDDVSNKSDLRSSAYTALASLTVDTVVGAATNIAEAQAKSGALAAGNAAARRPLLHEIIALEQRTREGTLGPSGIIRLQALRQTDYQLEAAALDAMAAYQEKLSSGILGPSYDVVFNTDNLAEQFSSSAESWRRLSYYTMAVAGREFERALNRYEASLNYQEYGNQQIFDRS